MQAKQSRIRPFSNRNRKSGQGTVEFILLLFITFVIGFGLLWQFSTAFRVFGQNYFGNYFVCLMESGELPRIGGGSGGECDSAYAPFSLKDGRPLINPNGIGGGGGPLPGGNSAATKEKTPGTNGDITITANARAGAPSSVPAGAAAGGGTSGRGRVPIATKTTTTKVTKNEGRGRGASGFQDTSSFSASEESGGDGRSRYVSTNEDESAAVANNSNSLSVNGSGGKPKRVPANDVVKGVKTGAGDDDVNLTFPTFVRYLLIAGICIAVFMYLGGQAASISKSDSE